MLDNKVFSEHYLFLSDTALDIAGTKLILTFGSQASEPDMWTSKCPAKTDCAEVGIKMLWLTLIDVWNEKWRKYTQTY